MRETILIAIICAAWCAGGYMVADTKWQAKWSARDAADAQATSKAQAHNRNKEQQLQIHVNEVEKNANEKVLQAQRDAASATVAANSLRQAADRAARRLADSEASGNACTAESRKARADAARVLADVLSLADERAGKLAQIADRARIAGGACEAAYDAARGVVK